MEKTLYLNENNDIKVLRDGPSIWIYEKDKAGRRIPARLVSRVVVIGSFKLDAGIITLFTDNDIPVTFLNRKGERAAVLLPYKDKEYDCKRWQRLFLLTEESKNRFITWAEAKRKGLQIEIIRRLSSDAAKGYCKNGFDESDYEDIIQKAIKTEDRYREIVHNAVIAIFREATAAALIKAQLDPDFGIIHRRADFGLVKDLCYILQPEADIQALQFFKTSGWEGKKIERESPPSLTNEGMKDIIIRFENRRKFLQEIIEILIDDIFEMMRDLKSEFIKVTDENKLSYML